MAPTSLRPLRHRSFALALSSSLVSSIGTWMQSVALGIYLTERTHDPIWLGALTAAAWLPAVVSAPVGGVLADRWSRPRWIQANNLALTLVASALAALALTHHLTPLWACALATLDGLCSSASWAAWQSLLPDLVDPDEVLAAVSLSSAQFNLGRIVGPVAAAVALAAGSVEACFAANAASFLAVLVAFAFVRAPARPRPEGRVRIVAETIHGARRAWSVPGCRNPIVAIAGLAVLASPFITLVPAMAILVLHAGARGTSLLVTAQGVGAVVGAFVLPSVAARTSRVAVLAGSVVVLVVVLALYALAPSLGLAAVAMVVVGGSYMGTLTGLNASVQIHAPTAERSRIIALYNLSLSVFFPIGSLAQATLAHHVGVRAVTLAGAGAVAVGLALVRVGAPGFWRAMGPAEAVAALAD